MAELSAKITQSSPRDFDEAVLNQITDIWSARRENVRAAIEEEIRRAVLKVRAKFQPQKYDFDFIGQLGVGKAGAPLLERLNQAYKLLIPSKGGKVARINTSFQKRASRFGKVKYTIDIDKFYDSYETTYISYSSDNREKIPWMEHFIKGIVVRDHIFIDEKDERFNPKSSRTGLGQMFPAPGRQYVFRGVGTRETFGALLREVEKRLASKKFVKKIEQILRS